MLEKEFDKECKEKCQYSQSSRLIMLEGWRKQYVLQYLKSLNFVKPSVNEKNSNCDRSIFQFTFQDRNLAAELPCDLAHPMSCGDSI